jgi:hypothetical protein
VGARQNLNTLGQTMKRPSIRLGAIASLLLVASCATSAPPDRALSFNASGATFHNPERGFYGFGELTASTNFAGVRSAGFSLCYTPLDLSAHRTQTIPESRLNDIRAAFANQRAAGVKGILRIVYNQESAGTDTTLAWIEAHLQQLRPVLEENLDMIAFYQAGIIGAWGEWHSSTNNLDTAPGRAAVWQLLVQYLPGCQSIAVRTPTYVYELEGANLPLAPGAAFGCTGAARIAHHNDCWLATATDMGTYNSDADRLLWLDLMAVDTQFVPWGGETCPAFDIDDNPIPAARAQCDTAITELTAYHGTYLNYYYHQPTLNQLAGEESTEYPAGCLTEMSMRLGYRIQLESAMVPGEIDPGQQIVVQTDLRNVGFAPVYNSRQALLLLLDSTGAILHEHQSVINLQELLPEATATTFQDTFNAPETLPPGPYGLALFFPDANEDLRADPRYSIRLATNGVWNFTTGVNRFVNDITGDGGSVAGVNGWAID